MNAAADAPLGATVGAKASLPGATGPCDEGRFPVDAMVAATASSPLMGSGVIGRCAGAPGAPMGVGTPSRAPQCWQNVNPPGVCAPQALHVRCDGIAGTGAGAGAIGAGARPTDAGGGRLPNGEATGGGAVAARSGVPHDLQKFMPGGFTTAHAGQVVPDGTPATGVCAFTLVIGTSAGGAADGTPVGAGPAPGKRVPQSWQKTEPSRFTRPQCVQRAMVASVGDGHRLERAPACPLTGGMPLC